MNAIKLGRSMGLLLAAGIYSTTACSGGSNGDGDGDTNTTDTNGDGDGDVTTKSGDGDGDTEGDGDGDGGGPGDGDGDTGAGAPGDGDGDGDTENPGDGDGDTENPGDGDGDTENPGDGDGDGDGDTGPVFEQEKAFLLDNAINPYGVLVASDDKIYISGTTDTGGVGLGDTQQNANLRLAVWRLNADGNIDTTWGTSGKAIATAIVNPGTSYDIVELADGSFVVHYAGTAGVSVVSLSAAGVFGTPTLLEFGWTPAERAEVGTLCTAAATTAKAVADAELADGVCELDGEVEGPNYDLEACTDLEDAADAAATACTDVWPAATAPAFAQRPAADASWGMSLDKSSTPEKLVITAFGPAPKVTTGTQRTDNDRYITRVSASTFAIDGGFNGGAVFSLDVSNLKLSDGARRGMVEADGSIVSGGYTNIGNANPSVGVGLGNHIALIRLLPNGTPDPDFGFSSVAAATVNPGQTLYNPYLGTGTGAEVYGVAKLSTGAYVTTGYGTSHFSAPSLSVDAVITAYNPSKDQDGLDPAFGGNAAGVVGAMAVQSEIDPNAGISGTNPYMDRGRHIVALPDDRTVHGGVYDDTAAFFIITPDGKLDETVGFGTGRIQYSGFPFAFFGLTVNSDGDRIVGASQSKARVNATTNASGATVLGKYAQSLIAIVDVEDDM